MIAVVGDVHVGNFREHGGEFRGGLNERCRLTAGTLTLAVAEAEEAGASMFIVAGDMFHVKRPEGAVIAAVQRALLEGPPRGMGVVVLPGNHDMPEATAAEGNTACEPLVPAVQRVVRTPELLPAGDGAEVLLVPFSAEAPMAEIIARALAERPASSGSPPARWLVTHVGVFDDSDAFWAKEAKDAISAERLFALMEPAGISGAIVGNYHKHRSWERGAMRIVQCGTLNPTGFSDEGLEGVGSLILAECGEGGAMEWRREEIPGPRFVICREGQPPAAPAGCKVFVRAVGSGFPEAPDPSWGLAGYTHEDAPAPEEQPAAAGGAPPPESAEEAIADYVGRLALQSEEDRARVLEIVNDCWRRA